MSARAQSPVGSVRHDWNCREEDDGSIHALVSPRTYHGMLPKVGDVVRVVDPDPSCGEVSGLVKRIDDRHEEPGGYFGDWWFGIYFEPLSDFVYWCDQDRPVTTSSVPDWIMRTYDAMRGGPDYIGDEYRTALTPTTAQRSSPTSFPLFGGV